MNLQAMIFFVLVILFMVRRRSGTIKIIMDAMLLITFGRLLLILSNMNQDVNPMVYPV
jgi:hypothetical protein